MEKEKQREIKQGDKHIKTMTTERERYLDKDKEKQS